MQCLAGPSILVVKCGLPKDIYWAPNNNRQSAQNSNGRHKRCLAGRQGVAWAASDCWALRQVHISAVLLCFELLPPISFGSFC